MVMRPYDCEGLELRSAPPPAAPSRPARPGAAPFDSQFHLLRLTADAVNVLTRLAAQTGSVGRINFDPRNPSITIGGRKSPMQMIDYTRNQAEVFIPSPAIGGGAQIRSLGLCRNKFTQSQEEFAPKPIPNPAAAAEKQPKAKTVGSVKSTKASSRKRKKSVSFPSSSSPKKKSKKTASNTPPASSGKKKSAANSNNNSFNVPQKVELSPEFKKRYPKLKSMKAYRQYKSTFDATTKDYFRLLGELKEHKERVGKKWALLDSAEREGSNKSRKKAKAELEKTIAACQAEVVAVYKKAKMLNQQRQHIGAHINAWCEAYNAT